MKPFAPCAVCILIFGLLPAFAQEPAAVESSGTVNPLEATAAAPAGSPEIDEDTGEVFAPFARNLRIALKEPQVRISWEDTSAIASSFLVYRHTEEITSENLAKASLIAEVDKSSNFYTDVPPSSGSWFYAVLLKDASGTIYEFLIPFRNKTVEAITINVTPTTSDQATELSNIKAKVSGKSIEVSVLSSRNQRAVSLWRSSSPITQQADLAKAVLLTTASGGEITFTDNPIPGIPYYYAAVDAVSWELGTTVLVAGKSVLAQPIEIQLASPSLAGVRMPAQRPVRAFPLPDLSQFIDSTELPSRNGYDMDPKLESRIQVLAAAANKTVGLPPMPEARLLPSDRILQNEVRGNAASLRDVLRNHFAEKDYQRTIEKLTKLATLNLSGETKTKTRYYLAIAKAMLDRKQEAVLDFLLVRDELEEYAEPWISALLARL